jgi:hypothetical protein
VIGGKNPRQKQSIVGNTGGVYSSPGGVKNSLTTLEFHRLESQETCIQIREVAKSKTSNR